MPQPPQSKFFLLPATTSCFSATYLVDSIQVVCTPPCISSAVHTSPIAGCLSISPSIDTQTFPCKSLLLHTTSKLPNFEGQFSLPADQITHQFNQSISISFPPLVYFSSYPSLDMFVVPTICCRILLDSNQCNTLWTFVQFTKTIRIYPLMSFSTITALAPLVRSN